MKQHITVYDVGDNDIHSDGIINICNIEEIWLNEYTNSVSIRFRSPDGQLVEHEEYYDAPNVARERFLRIADCLDCDKPTSMTWFKTSIENQKENMEEE